MPSIDENVTAWGESYDWLKDGDEWSAAWGGVIYQWFGVIYPRIHQYLAGGTILEIAPGHGRWTKFLASQGQYYIGVDVSESCVAVCRDRFRMLGNVEFHVNDGRSLDCVADGAVDFVFSFDSLVHAEADAIGNYIGAMAKKLGPNGVAFIHHSNLAAYPLQGRLSAIPKLRGILRMAKILEPSLHWRAPTMDAVKLVELCGDSGLCCTSQELINWGDSRGLIDCFSVITRLDSIWARKYRLLRNDRFMRDAQTFKMIADVYGFHGPGS